MKMLWDVVDTGGIMEIWQRAQPNSAADSPECLDRPTFAGPLQKENEQRRSFTSVQFSDHNKAYSLSFGAMMVVCNICTFHCPLCLVSKPAQLT
jgi:hypothetical protein